MKRRKAEWGTPLGPEDLEQIKEQLAEIQRKGVQYEPLQLNEKAIILHIKVPKRWSADEISETGEWARRLRAKLPENCFCLVTTDELELKVYRPGDPDQALQRAIGDLTKRLNDLEDRVGEHYEQIDRMQAQMEPYPQPEESIVDKLNKALKTGA